jgi:serine/threonine-protein kinase
MDIVAPSVGSIEKQFSKITSIELLAVHGFKAVYKVQNAGTIEALKLIQIPVASKTSDEQEAERNEGLGRAKREVEALGKFNVPEIVKLGKLKPETISLEGHDYLAYTEEFLTGKNLGEIISENSGLPKESEIKLLFLSMVKAVKEIWEKDYIHRDIKPKNIMRTENLSRRFVLLDLGVALSIHGESLTMNPKALVGTLLYMAPEEFEDNYKDNIDFRCDLYSSALTVYEYASHVHPLKKSDGEARTIYRILHQEAEPLKSYRSDLSDELCGLIDGMLKKKPANRPGNMELLIRTLEQ